MLVGGWGSGLVGGFSCDGFGVLCMCACECADGGLTGAET